jgi:hypothetical protein
MTKADFRHEECKMRCLMIGMAVAGLAASFPARAADERRLSPAEVEKILEAAAVKNKVAADQAKPAEAPPKPARPVQGEVGVSVGTGGYRSAYGTAIMPIGEEGVAVISVGTEEYGRRKRRR